MRALLAVVVLACLLATACGGGGGDGDGSQPTFEGPSNGEGNGTPVPDPTGRGGQPLGVLDSRRPEVGEPAPDFALVDARDGTVRKLSDYRGQAVVLNWYASWCKPCKAEIPQFQAASEALAGEVVFLGVDYKEDAEKAAGILEALGATYPALLDPSGKVYDHYVVSVPGLPETYFIDADGILRGIRIGEVRADHLEDNLAKLGVVYVVPD